MSTTDAGNILLSFLDQCENYIKPELAEALRIAIAELGCKPEDAKWC